MMKDQKPKIAEVCPRGLMCCPTEACPLAMDRINALKAEGPACRRSKEPESLPGCPWHVSSRDHHYCFWVLAETLQDDPMTDREICDLLLISPETLEAVFQSACRKWSKLKNSEMISALRDLVAELSRQRPVDYSNYIPEDFREVLDRVESQKATTEDLPPAEKAAIRRDRGMPIHRDGHKKDLFGLYSPKTRERMAKEESKKKKPEKK
jgi:hypothetical protein